MRSADHLFTLSCSCASPVVLPDFTSAQKQVLYCSMGVGDQKARGVSGQACRAPLAAGLHGHYTPLPPTKAHQVIDVGVRLAPAQVVAQRAQRGVEHRPRVKHGRGRERSVREVAGPAPHVAAAEARADD